MYCEVGEYFDITMDHLKNLINMCLVEFCGRIWENPLNHRLGQN